MKNRSRKNYIIFFFIISSNIKKLSISPDAILIAFKGIEFKKFADGTSKGVAITLIYLLYLLKIFFK